VVTFDDAGVGGSTGSTPGTIEQMAVFTWGIPDHALLQRVTAIDVPVFVANGDCDPMILPRYSYLLAGLIPHARVKIYPDSAHGFWFQHHAEVAADIEAFLTGAN
jgi:pimeloyl-ACP methyl ester carboxylesterase